MNLALLVLIVITGGAAYYEYTSGQQTNAGFQQQLGEWQGKVSALQSGNKSMEDEKTELSKKISDDNTEIADLTTKLKTAQLEAKKEVAKIAPTLNLQTNQLGTITTITGKAYPNCTLLKVEPDGIIVNDANGITKVLFALMPPELQKRFSYDPSQAAERAAEQAQHVQELRQSGQPAASGAPGTSPPSQ